MSDDQLPQLDQDPHIAPTPQRSIYAQRGPVAQRRQRTHRPQRPQNQPRQQQALPTPTPTAAPALPKRIATRWTGVDKKDMPRFGNPPVIDPGWMGTLIDTSNLRFTGVYVTAPALTGPGISPSNFTNSSKDANRGWMTRIQALTDQGWGAAFFYLSYSVGGNEPAPAAGVDAARGQLHGKHLRTAITTLGAGFAGAVIFLDNEDSVSVSLPATLVDYYRGLFAEMIRPDPTLAACRPGLYGHGQPVRDLLAVRPELYIWDVDYDTSTTTTPDAPFGDTLPVTIDPVSRALKAYVASPAGVQASIAWSIGRQFRSYTGNMPKQTVTPPRAIARWPAVSGWDYNTSFVRNPAFPEAEPRFAVLPRAGQALTVAGTFAARAAGPPATPPMSRIGAQSATGNAEIPLATGITVEPDSPLLLFDAGPAARVCTVLAGNRLGVGELSASGTWTSIDAMGGTVPQMRRIRSLAAFSRSASESTVFFVGADHQLYVKRKQGTSAWEDAAAICATGLHPFSRIAACARGSVYEVYFIDQAGLLNNAFFIVGGTSTWPAFQSGAVETAPSLIPDGPLAIAAPSADTVLFFAVGLDWRLAYGAFVQGQGFGGVLRTGQPQDLLTPHTRLAVNKINNSTLEVAALTDSGQAATYVFQRTGDTWTPHPRTVVADPPALAGNPPPVPRGAVVQAAQGFRINPYGDLALFRSPSATASTLFCAGLRNGETHLVTCDLGSTTWQFFV